MSLIEDNTKPYTFRVNLASTPFTTSKSIPSVRSHQASLSFLSNGHIYMPALLNLIKCQSCVIGNAQKIKAKVGW